MVTRDEGLRFVGLGSARNAWEAQRPGDESGGGKQTCDSAQPNKITNSTRT